MNASPPQSVTLTALKNLYVSSPCLAPLLASATLFYDDKISDLFCPHTVPWRQLILHLLLILRPSCCSFRKHFLMSTDHMAAHRSSRIKCHIVPMTDCSVAVTRRNHVLIMSYLLSVFSSRIPDLVLLFSQCVTTASTISIFVYFPVR
jgi:hypothetical protein